MDTFFSSLQNGRIILHLFFLMIYCGDSCNQSAISRHFRYFQPFATTNNDAIFFYRHIYVEVYPSDKFQEVELLAKGNLIFFLIKKNF